MFQSSLNFVFYSELVASTTKISRSFFHTLFQKQSLLSDFGCAFVT